MFDLSQLTLRLRLSFQTKDEDDSTSVRLTNEQIEN
jgi:hypothetical protein